MIKYIRNLIHSKDVTIDCDIINNFEEKIQAFKSVKSYANKFIKLLDEPYTNHLFFKCIKREYDFNNTENKINLKLVISMNKKRALNLVLLTSDNYNTNYEECINIYLTNDCKIKSFRFFLKTIPRITKTIKSNKIRINIALLLFFSMQQASPE
jgi:hypothetical protein